MREAQPNSPNLCENIIAVSSSSEVVGGGEFRETSPLAATRDV